MPPTGRDTHAQRDTRRHDAQQPPASVVDSFDSFHQATSSVGTGAFKAIFETVVAERRGLRGEIEAAIAKAGGTPEAEGTMLASAHRVLMRLRDTVSKGDIAVVDEAERGEDHIKAKFEKAQADEALSPGVRQFVSGAAVRVKAGHDRIRDLKHSLHGK